MHYHRAIGDIGAHFSSSYLLIAHKLLQLSVQWSEGSFQHIVPVRCQYFLTHKCAQCKACAVL